MRFQVWTKVQKCLPPIIHCQAGAPAFQHTAPQATTVSGVEDVLNFQDVKIFYKKSPNQSLLKKVCGLVKAELPHPLACCGVE